MEDRQRLSFVFSQTMNDVIDAQMHKFPPCDKGNPDAQLKAVKFPSQDTNDITVNSSHKTLS